MSQHFSTAMQSSPASSGAKWSSTIAATARPCDVVPSPHDPSSAVTLTPTSPQPRGPTAYFSGYRDIGFACRNVRSHDSRRDCDVGRDGSLIRTASIFVIFMWHPLSPNYSDLRFSALLGRDD